MEVRWTQTGQKELYRLDRSTQERIKKAIHRLAETGHGDVRRVQERGGDPALRVGDWRIFFRTTTEEVGTPPKRIEVMHIIRIRSRGHAYGR
jgi:mRNA-degrading endonuclease RelE of RelBE toxin-antitoxin system